MQLLQKNHSIINHHIINEIPKTLCLFQIFTLIFLDKISVNIYCVIVV